MGKKGTTGKTNQGFNAELNTAKPYPLKRTYLKPLFLLRQNCLLSSTEGKVQSADNTGLEKTQHSTDAHLIKLHLRISMCPLEFGPWRTLATHKKRAVSFTYPVHTVLGEILKVFSGLI